MKSVQYILSALFLNFIVLISLQCQPKTYHPSLSFADMDLFDFLSHHNFQSMCACCFSPVVIIVNTFVIVLYQYRTTLRHFEMMQIDRIVVECDGNIAVIVAYCTKLEACVGCMYSVQGWQKTLFKSKCYSPENLMVIMTRIYMVFRNNLQNISSNSNIHKILAKYWN